VVDSFQRRKPAMNTDEEEDYRKEIMKARE
jgi:hypothetical protein